MNQPDYIDDGQQPPPQQDMYGGIGGYIPRGPTMPQDSLLNSHLNAEKTLSDLKRMLLGYEYNDEEDTWIKTKVNIVGNDGQTYEVEEGPIMDPKEVRITISYLQMFLNDNTFLSTIKEERINDIMWDISKKLGALFYRLRHKISPETKDMIWGMIEYPILMGLSRASNKITLDAMSKMQHTIENVNKNDNSEMAKKEFKLFGM